MPIIINIDVMLAESVGITMANISILKNEKAKAIRLSTLEAICKALDYQPGDILEYKKQEHHLISAKSFPSSSPLLIHQSAYPNNEFPSSRVLQYLRYEHRKSRL